MLQIGAFVAGDEPVAQLMLDQILSGPRWRSCRRVTFFAFADAPGLAAALRQRGLSVDRYWYLARDLTRTAPPALPDFRRWRTDDIAGDRRLCWRALRAARPTRGRSRRAGRADEWADYVDRLTKAPAAARSMPRRRCAFRPGPAG